MSGDRGGRGSDGGGSNVGVRTGWADPSAGSVTGRGARVAKKLSTVAATED